MICLEYSNIYPTRCNFTQFILSGNCSTCFRWCLHPSSGVLQLYLQHLVFVTPLLLPAAIAAGSSNGLLPAAIAAGSSNGVTNRRCCRYSCSAPDDGWRHHLKHVEQFPDKISCVKLHLVGYVLEYYYDARTHER